MVYYSDLRIENKKKGREEMEEKKKHEIIHFFLSFLSFRLLHNEDPGRLCCRGIHRWHSTSVQDFRGSTSSGSFL